MARPRIAVADAAGLRAYYRATITPAELDAMGHMNVRHYMAHFDNAAWRFFASFGLDDNYYAQGTGGAFALAQHIQYLDEVRVGETIAVHCRLLGRSAKRIHFIHFMVNETRPGVAATLEVLGSHADVVARRTSPFPASIAARIDALLAEHQGLGWEPPLCGVLQP